jgi:hypothetical protein
MDSQPTAPDSKPITSTITSPAPSTRSPRKNPAKAILLGLLIAVLAGGGAAAYWMRDQQAKKDTKSKDSEITSLKSQLHDAEMADEATAGAGSTHSDQKTADDVNENIAASISSGNTAALEGYMAAKVRVIIAASEGVGDRTPTQAISDLKYLDDATDPWNFDLPAATLNAYSTGEYAQYFPLGAVVGKSADDMVVSFTFDALGDINGIFMAVKAELL